MNDQERELQMEGLQKHYNYTQYAHDNHINVIPEKDFKQLISDTFKALTDTLRGTYGPYGTTMVLIEQSETTTTKDGYNVYRSLGPNHAYKRMVYLAIKQIIDRVNRNVGDGTTSCILLAEKMFNNIKGQIETPEDRRRVLHALNYVEKMLQDHRDLKDDIEKGELIQQPLEETIRNVIMMASNYDVDLCGVLMQALNPISDENGVVTEINQVSARSDVTYEADSMATYQIDHLPGDYRIRVQMATEFAMMLSDPIDVKVIVYDHAFNQTDWLCFKDVYDGSTPVILIARTFTKDFLDNEWKDYLTGIAYKNKMNAKANIRPTIYLVEMRGSFVQNELADIAAVLGTKARGMNEMKLDYSQIPTATIQVYGGDCMAFYGVKAPEEYIKLLKFEMENEKSKSYVKKQAYAERIKALEMKTKDAQITVRCGTSLEAKMIMDKIDDCTAIVSSAINSGIVPNLLNYAYHRVSGITCAGDDKGEEVIEAIKISISELFDDIWRSKYLGENGEKLMEFKEHFYKSTGLSFNILKDTFVKAEELPTSAQYDLEVVVAAISIVKYLLTSRALIFDAHILPPVNDSGYYS